MTRGAEMLEAWDCYHRTIDTWGGPYPTVVPVGGTSTTITGLTYSTQYYFVVSSVNGLGESLNSYQSTARVQGPPRTSVVGSAADG